jgi:transcription initiation factor TFIIIB Brf1 subunit/transcription initiation factor TFIIB
MRKYLKCNFVKDYNNKKPNYHTDSISNMKQALQYYEEVIDDIDSQMDEVFSYFREFVSSLKLDNEIKENAKEFIQNVQELEFSPRDRS